MRHGSLALAVALLALGASSPASAAPGVVTRAPNNDIKVDFGDAVSGDSFFVIGQGGEAGTIELTSNGPGGAMTDSALFCSSVDANTVNCDVHSAQKLTVELGPGADFTEFQILAVPVQTEIFGEAGNDGQLWGSENDDLIDGGPGDDELDSFGGDDVLRGGSGEDNLNGWEETDDIRGGPGFDLVDYFGATAGVHVTVDDIPGDGPPGENDNVHTDVEDIDGSNASDTIVGSGASNIIFGGAGNDVIDGGGGVDTIDAGSDNDVVTSRDGLEETVDCGDGADSLVADDIDVSAGCEAEQRSSIFQSDLDGDGASRPLDCDDRNAAIRPGAAEAPDDGVDQNCDGADATDPDRDRDGIPRPADCDDSDAAVRPGARERRGNRVDEDCNGRAEPFLIVTNSVPNSWAAGAVTRNLALGVRDVVKGMTVELRCRGGGCPLKRKLVVVKRKRRLLDLHPLLRGAALRPGAVVELRIRRRGAIGKAVRYTIRRGAPPLARSLCLRPGKKRPSEC